MKKIGIIVLVIIGSIAIFLLGFGYKTPKQPNTYYQVYLNEKVIGVINSKEELEEYIDKQGEHIKKKFNVDTVYAPDGLEIKKLTTYNKQTDDVSKIYNIIQEEEPFTIKGYQFSIIEDDDKQNIYTLNQDIFDDAVEEVIKIFVGEEEYENYLEDTQPEIETTGTIIENVYVDEDITIKEKQIPVDEKIYSSSDELAQYLLFGDEIKRSKYIIRDGDTINQIAFNNQISVEEFLISNPDINSSSDLLFAGQEVNIVQTNPQINVIVEEYVVQDIVSQYRTEEQFDSSRLEGDDEVIQQGSNGLERVTQNVKLANREILYVDPVSKEELEPTVNEIVVRGSKIIPTVGSLTNWAWPTNSGYTISSDYGYRIDPIRGTRLLHDGLDISGTGHGSPVYSANNGVVVQLGYHYMNGNYIVVNHNNGYYTMYAHLSGFNTTNGATVAKGQVIGFVGNTGYSTGPHLHFGVATGGIPYYGGRLISPWTLYN